MPLAIHWQARSLIAKERVSSLYKMEKNILAGRVRRVKQSGSQLSRESRNRDISLSWGSPLREATSEESRLCRSISYRGERSGDH